MKRANYITPLVGQTYTDRNGYQYLCRAVKADGVAVMGRTSDSWTLDAHGIQQYDDGTIEWDYSTGGHWIHQPTLIVDKSLKYFESHAGSSQPYAEEIIIRYDRETLEMSVFINGERKEGIKSIEIKATDGRPPQDYQCTMYAPAPLV